MYSVRTYRMKKNVFSLISQDDFVKLEGIHTLDLSRNRLTKLPDNFGQLKSLKQLDLYDNRISNLPLSFCDLTKLDVNIHPSEEHTRLLHECDLSI